MKLREIKSKFTKITGLKAIAANAKKYLKEKMDLRRKDTWRLLLKSITEEVFSPIRLSEIIKFVITGCSKFKKKLKRFCQELIGAGASKRMTYYEHIDFVILTGLYIDDTGLTPASARGILFSSHRSLQFINYKDKSGADWMNTITTLIAAFPPVSSQQEARDNAFKLYKSIRYNSFNNLCPRLMGFYNHLKGEIWERMQDCLKWDKDDGYNLPTSVAEIEPFIKDNSSEENNVFSGQSMIDTFISYKFSKLKEALNNTYHRRIIYILKCMF